MISRDINSKNSSGAANVFTLSLQSPVVKYDGVSMDHDGPPKERIHPTPEKFIVTNSSFIAAPSGTPLRALLISGQGNGSFNVGNGSFNVGLSSSLGSNLSPATLTSGTTLRTANGALLLLAALQSTHSSTAMGNNPTGTNAAGVNNNNNNSINNNSINNNNQLKLNPFQKVVFTEHVHKSETTNTVDTRPISNTTPSVLGSNPSQAEPTTSSPHTGSLSSTNGSKTTPSSYINTTVTSKYEEVTSKTHTVAKHHGLPKLSFVHSSKYSNTTSSINGNLTCSINSNNRRDISNGVKIHIFPRHGDSPDDKKSSGSQCKTALDPAVSDSQTSSFNSGLTPRLPKCDTYEGAGKGPRRENIRTPANEISIVAGLETQNGLGHKPHSGETQTKTMPNPTPVFNRDFKLGNSRELNCDFIQRENPNRSLVDKMDTSECLSCTTTAATPTSITITTKTSTPTPHVDLTKTARTSTTSPTTRPHQHHQHFQHPDPPPPPRHLSISGTAVTSSPSTSSPSSSLFSPSHFSLSRSPLTVSVLTEGLDIPLPSRSSTVDTPLPSRSSSLDTPLPSSSASVDTPLPTTSENSMSDTEMSPHPLSSSTGAETGRRLRARNSSRKFLPEKTRHKRQTLQDMTRPLKMWLVSHRENPYPSKLDKLELVKMSRMSMTQVSNWFANARRRLKNTVKGDNVTWATRIKSYNKYAEGNAELLSIPSDIESWDSEDEMCHEDSDHAHLPQTGESKSATPSPAPTLTSSLSDTALTSPATTQSLLTSPSGTTRNSPALEDNHGGCHKYKHSILQRYLQDAAQQAMLTEEEVTSRSRHRYLSSSTGSHEFEYLSTSSVSSPSHETHHDTFEDFSEEMEIVNRRKCTENTKLNTTDEMYWKEIGAALALTSLARTYVSK
ncbi:mucin-5AC-like [Physella acuta]|uniref:mucin-5AC-like n=1 Tax=Physella acuta TaxID=109671 RepID=UPI0027DBA097|nr:mucin-5AC-like [Physella acuta]